MALSNLTKVQTLGIGSNIEVVGVITTGQFKSGTSNLHSTGVELTNLNVSGIATIGGNVSIGGTLTYQDVTNIDSVGLITARAGINITGGNITLGDSSGSSDDRIKLGASNDCHIHHNGTDTFISNDTGDLVLNNIGGNSDDIFIRSKDDITLQVQSSENAIVCKGDDAVELYYNNAKTLSTFVNALHLFGNQYECNIDLKLDNGNRVGFIGVTNSGRVQINGAAGGSPYETYFEGNLNGSSKLFFNNSSKLETTNTGAVVTGIMTATSFSGDGSNLTGITGTTINNNADNRVITGSGSANTLNGESNVQIDSGGRLSVGNSQASTQYSGSNDLVIGNTTGEHGITIISNTNNRGRLMFSRTYSADTQRYDGQILYDHQTTTMNFYSNYTNNQAVAMQLGGGENQLFVGIDKGSTTTYNNRSAYFHRATDNFISITGGSSSPAGIVFGDTIANNTGNYETYMHHTNSTNDFWIRVNQGNDNRHLKITQAGNVEIGNGNLVMASGHGIDFSADGSGTLKTLPNSFNAELLHDYENGTFTPNIQYDTGTNRYAGGNVSSAVGEYIRIGDLVNFGMKITLTGNRNYSENTHIYIGGLPYNGMHSSFQSSMQNGWGGWACPTNDNNFSYDVRYCFHGYTTVNLGFSQSSGNGGISGFYVWGFYRCAP